MAACQDLAARAGCRSRYGPDCCTAADVLTGPSISPYTIAALDAFRIGPYRVTLPIHRPTRDSYDRMNCLGVKTGTFDVI